MKKPVPFKTESDLCSAFVAALPKAWTSYNESAGWDMLLVRADGFQVGIQAKLRLNPVVLAQCLSGSRYRDDYAGPDCRAILVPWGGINIGMQTLAPYVGITIIRMGADHHRAKYMRRPFDPALPGDGYDDYWFEQAPTKRCKLPEYVPDVVPGKPSPVQLTQWKIGALKIAVLLEANGYVTRKDFRHVGIDHRRWIAPGVQWLRVDDGKFVPANRLPNFKAQHPVVFEQVKADLPKWGPSPAVLPPRQEALL